PKTPGPIFVGTRKREGRMCPGWTLGRWTEWETSDPHIRGTRNERFLDAVMTITVRKPAVTDRPHPAAPRPVGALRILALTVAVALGVAACGSSPSHKAQHHKHKAKGVHTVVKVLAPKSGAKVSGTVDLDATAAKAVSVKFRLAGGGYGYGGLVLCNARRTEYGWGCKWDSTTVPNHTYAVLSQASAPGTSPEVAAVDITVDNLGSPSSPTGSANSSGSSSTTSTTVPSKASQVKVYTEVEQPSNGASVKRIVKLVANASIANTVSFRLFGGGYGLAGQLLCTANFSKRGWSCRWSSTTVPNGSYVLVSQATYGGQTVTSRSVHISVSNG
ncbi:MAG: hypothetical protein ACRDV4_11490, partial [Acidimicrobiales bacterium]